MKELKKYFSRKSNFSLKERFNMMVTLLTCFFTGVLGENGKALQRVKGLECGQAGTIRGWLAALTGWIVSGYRIGEVAGKIMPGRFLQRNVMKKMHVQGDGQALVDGAGMRGKRGNRIRDVSHEKGLPCIGRSMCRGSPGWEAVKCSFCCALKIIFQS
ncbi:hypothetical protein LIQ05_17205 [Blautia glucerasea]|mgnify:FL=1|uniref:hypothetical protein n=1 Tax=Blautia glucerasea TaxID=536633 RepID=UPI001D00442B|nr:hypothetical protein [Blautia glucerasea]MCB5388700.1 hypothetical protein [Blautia glucerasea]MCB5423230.1 hypothetical protein [Blautia luti]